MSILIISSIFLFILIIVIYLFKYGLLGLKLTIKRNEMDSTIHTIHHGIHSFNRSILEDLQKMKQMNAALMQINTNNQHREEAAIFDDVSQLLDRLKYKLSTLNDKKKDIQLEQHPLMITHMIKKSLQELHKEQKVKIKLQFHIAFSGLVLLYSDPPHLIEAFKKMLQILIQQDEASNLEITIYASFVRGELLIELKKFYYTEFNRLQSLPKKPSLSTKHFHQSNLFAFSYIYHVFDKHRATVAYTKNRRYNKFLIRIPMKHIHHSQKEFV